MATEQRRPGIGSDWEEVDTIVDANGIMAVISRHKDRIGKFSVGIWATFTRPNTTIVDKTMWIPHGLLGAAQQVLKDANARIEQLIAKMKSASNPNANDAKTKTR